jgi:hypothetical protein
MVRTGLAENTMAVPRSPALMLLIVIAHIAFTVALICGAVVAIAQVNDLDAKLSQQ